MVVYLAHTTVDQAVAGASVQASTQPAPHMMTATKHMIFSGMTTSILGTFLIPKAPLYELAINSFVMLQAKLEGLTLQW